jgi:ABC-type multidrug transport system fused ATPase/permease subunit
MQKTRHEENTSQHKLAHRSITMIITLVIITVDTIMRDQLFIVINVIIVIVLIFIIITIISSKSMLANQSSSSSPSPQTASKPSFFHHHNHNRRHHNAQETLVTSRHRKHQRGKKEYSLSMSNKTDYNTNSVP